MHELPRPGWYPDPWQHAWYRWWDGRQWTATVHPSGGEASAGTPRHTSPSFATLGAPAILAGTLISILLATWAGDTLDFRQHWQGIVVVYTVLFGTMACWCVLLSRRFGTGHVRQDFGLRIMTQDIGWGALVFIGTMIGRVIVAIVLPRETRNPMDDVQRALQLDHGVLVAFSFAALLGAPIVEELVFRGALQRSLTRRLGAPTAIIIQAVLFAGYHFVPSTGRFSLLYFASLAVFGAA
ncbi:MAG TPA: CPBP family glutamic-type intramembrane protease, partial [Acidimicrobiales bacterium]|nr:CPBP family glutamic-type intramembrane protease [Acidimicrobiales bacterium]